MSISAYFFEAKSIQGYILATNRLKEMVGGSELIEGLTGSEESQESLLDAALAALEAGDRLRFSRRGGGAFSVFGSDTALVAELARLWPLLVRQYAPDLEFVQAHTAADDEQEAYAAARDLLDADRNRLAARLPQAGPFAVRNRRTGEPATAFVRNKKNPTEREPVDAATRRKLRFAGGAALGRRFAEDSRALDWPRNLNPADRDWEAEDEESSTAPGDFPFNGESRYLALVHADGNRLGRILIDLRRELPPGRSDRFVEDFYAFSQAVGRATQAAAREATEQVLQPHRSGGVYPARPIVLGGDDLTILLRADLGLSFARRFLAGFAEHSERELRPLRGRLPLPERLTACAGVAYFKATQPFYLMHGLAEQLCKHAKDKAKRLGLPDIPSALALHRVTTALIDDYKTILDTELTHPPRRQTLECYGLEPDKGLPLLDDLLSLVDLLQREELARGPAREVLGLVGASPEQARRRYRRWREVLGERAPARLGELDAVLERLVGAVEDDLPFGPVDPGDGLHRSPLGDANSLIAIGSLP
jgi:hypothetical protein